MNSMDFQTVLPVLQIAGLCAVSVIALDFSFYLLAWIFIFFVTRFYSIKKEYFCPSRFSYFLLNFGYRIICRMARVKIHFNEGIASLNPGESKAEKAQAEEARSDPATPETAVKSESLSLPEGNFLFVSNHISKFDNMIHSICFGNKNRLAFVSKPENFKIPMGGRLIKRNCYIRLERGVGRSAIEMIHKTTGLISNRICSIGIFPEGTRSTDGNLLPFKPGVFKIAERAGCPVVVGVTRNTQSIHKNFPLKKTHVYFDIIKVYSLQEVQEKGTQALSEEIENLVKKALNGSA